MVAAVQPGIGRATIPRWSQPWLYPARYKSAAGGRGAGRTHTFSELCVLRMDGKLPAYEPGPVTIAAARQFQNSISESCKKAMEFYIKKLGLSDRFVVRNYAIDNKVTGSHCFFPGFNRNPQSLMSAEGVDILWVEQAETLGDEMELIVPTIRAPGSELWFSWNPAERLQWCWQRFAVNPRPDDVVVWCNWNDNPWFPDELEEERVRFQMENPDRYQHVWEGTPDDGDADTQVLTYNVLRQCVKAWDEGLAPPYDDAPVTDGGLDLAFGGGDRCAIVVRRGPVIEHLDTWPGVAGYLTPAASRAHQALTENDAYRLYYDATGGDTIMGEFMRLDPDYQVLPVNFGGKVAGPGVMYEPRRTNEQVFARRNAQMAFNLRLRAHRTVRLLNGDEDVDPVSCLFIRSDIPRLEQYLSEMTQPKYRTNPTTGQD